MTAEIICELSFAQESVKEKEEESFIFAKTHSCDVMLVNSNRVGAMIAKYEARNIWMIFGWTFC